MPHKPKAGSDTSLAEGNICSLLRLKATPKANCECRNSDGSEWRKQVLLRCLDAGGMVCWFDQQLREKVCSRADVSQSRRNDLIGAENAIPRGGAYGRKRG
jgi:hypothetical protein